MASTSFARKIIPKKLEEDLSNIPRFKPREVPNSTGSSSRSGSRTVSKALDDSIERAMFDEILGPLVNPGSYRRPASVSSPLRSTSGVSTNTENLINAGSIKAATESPLISSSTSVNSALEHSRDVISNTSNGAGGPLLRSPRKITAPNGSSNNNNSFNDSILARLTSVESENKDLRKQLAEKIQRLEQVEADNARLRRVLLAEDEDVDDTDEDGKGDVVLGSDGILRGTIGASSAASNGCNGYPRAQMPPSVATRMVSHQRLLDDLEDLRQDNAALEQQVADMEQFLSDYGLTWVGYEGATQGQASRLSPRENTNESKSKQNSDNNVRFETGNTTEGTAKGGVFGSTYYTLAGAQVPSTQLQTTANTDSKQVELRSSPSGKSSVLTSAQVTRADSMSADLKGKLDTTAKSSKADSQNDTIFHVDYHTFKRKVEALNEIIYSEPAQVRKDPYNSKTARIVQSTDYTEKIPITFYADGILIRRGPFRRNDSASFKAFCRDILDGYFPSDFKEQHPDGVLFELIDRHFDSYTSERSAGRTLVDGSIPQLQQSAPSFAQALTQEQLLQKMSGITISAAGNVTNPRQDLMNRLLPSNVSDIKYAAGSARTQGQEPRERDSSVVMPTGQHKDAPAGMDLPPSYELSGLLASAERLKSLGPAAAVADVKETSQTTHSKSSHSTSRSTNSNANIETSASKAVHGDASNEPSTTLIRIKWIDGTMYHMRLWKTDLVGDIRENLRRHLYNTSSDSTMGTTDGGAINNVYAYDNQQDTFEIRAAYPPRVLTNAMLLTEAGLVPNGTVHVMRCAR